jgi:hypothetical protein
MSARKELVSELGSITTNPISPSKEKPGRSSEVGFRLPARSAESPVSRLVIACARTKLDAITISEITNVLSGPLDWNHIFKIAHRNAVTPLLCRNLLTTFAGALGADVYNEVSSTFQQHVQRNMLATSKLLKLVEGFGSSGISILPFKGPLLAVQAYGELSLRKFVDLDVLIRPEDLEASIEILKKYGYLPVTSASWLQKTAWNISDKKDIVFISDDDSPPLELHWKLSGSHFSLPIEHERLLARAETITVGGRRIQTLSFNDLLIYLCLHGSRHSWERLGWISDINELIESNKEIDWKTLVDEAERLGCRNVLRFGMYLVHEFFGKEFPIRDWKAVKNDPTFRELGESIRTNLFSDDGSTWSINDRYLYHLQLKEKPLDKLKLHLHYMLWYLRIIFTPNGSDTSIVNLPRPLVSLYYILRPTRLFYTYVVKSRRGKS